MINIIYKTEKSILEALLKLLLLLLFRFLCFETTLFFKLLFEVRVNFLHLLGR